MKIDRLLVFYEFQVGPMLSSPKALPWFHILLKPPKNKKDMMAKKNPRNENNNFEYIKEDVNSFK